MPLTTRTNGSAPVNIVAASWWNDFKDLLTGVMIDQAVNINNSVNVNSLITDNGQNYGYYIADSIGVPQRCMHIHATDGDLHILTSPANDHVKITKSSYAYDIAVFDASGASGQTTLNGNLTCGTLTCTTIVAGAISPVSVTTGTVNTTALNVAGTVINFTGGNNGAIRNPAGGALDITAGGSAGLSFYNLAFGTLLANLNNAGLLTLSGVTASGTVTTGTVATDRIIGSDGSGHLVTTPGVGGLTRLADPLKLSFQIPGGSEQASLTSSALTVGVNTTINAALYVQSSIRCDNFIDSGGATHLLVTAGAGGVTRLEDNTKISFQVPQGGEKASLTATAFHSGVTFDAPAIHFALGGYAKVTNGNFYASSGNSFTFSHGLGSSSAVVHLIAQSAVVCWITATSSTQVTVAWAGSTPPYNVGYSGWLGG